MMVNPGKRRLKRKKTRVSSKTKIEYFKGQKGTANCAITGEKLAGTSNSTRGKASKKSKTQRRPSTPFGGILSGKAREKVFIELGKVVAGVKTIGDVEQKYRKYVKQAMKKAEKE